MRPCAAAQDPRASPASLICTVYVGLTFSFRCTSWVAVLAARIHFLLKNAGDQNEEEGMKSRSMKVAETGRR